MQDLWRPTLYGLLTKYGPIHAFGVFRLEKDHSAATLRKCMILYIRELNCAIVSPRGDPIQDSVDLNKWGEGHELARKHNTIFLGSVGAAPGTRLTAFQCRSILYHMCIEHGEWVRRNRNNDDRGRWGPDGDF